MGATTQSGRAITKEALRAETLAWAERVNARPRRVQVQAMRTKWASCSTRGTVTLSLDLLREPKAFREVVIVHELIHLLVPNHGRVFKALMKAYLPEWERTASGRVSRSCGFHGPAASCASEGTASARVRRVGVARKRLT
jgi:predicted metal-dependent hydrolase